MWHPTGCFPIHKKMNTKKAKYVYAKFHSYGNLNKVMISWHEFISVMYVANNFMQFGLSWIFYGNFFRVMKRVLNWIEHFKITFCDAWWILSRILLYFSMTEDSLKIEAAPQNNNRSMLQWSTRKESGNHNPIKIYAHKYKRKIEREIPENVNKQVNLMISFIYLAINNVFNLIKIMKKN
jgi:hypothetical protein